MGLTFFSRENSLGGVYNKDGNESMDWGGEKATIHPKQNSYLYATMVYTMVDL
jgi:hypothetical protein